MIKSALIEALKSFSRQEMKEFGEFVNSPFFNKNESVKKLYGYLKKYHPEYSQDKTEKETVYKKIFHGAEYNDGFMRTVMFKLGSLTEEFIAYKGFARNNVRRGITLLDELNERKLEKNFNKNFRETLKLHEKNPYKDVFYFKDAHDLLHTRSIYVNWTRFKNKNLNDYYSYNEKKIEHYILYAILRIFSYYTLAYHKKIIEGFSAGDTRFLDSVMKYLQHNKEQIEKNKVVFMGYHVIKLLRDNDDKSQKILLRFLQKEEKHIDYYLRYNLYSILQTYYQEKSYTADGNTAKSSFELFKISIAQGLCKAPEDKYFDDITFINTVWAGAAVKEFKWLEEFIETNSGFLAPENRNTTIAISNSKIFFEKGEFGKSLNCISSLKSIRHLQHKITARAQILLLYYELEMWEQAESFADSHRHFLSKHRKRFSEKRYLRQTNMLKFYVKLLKLKQKPRPQEIENLHKTLIVTYDTVYRTWLLNKTEILMKTAGYAVR